MRKRLSAAILGILMAAAAPLATMAQDSSTFRLGIYQDAQTLDPIASSDNGSIWVQLLIYDTLIRPSKDGTQLEPGLAESWTSNAEGTEFTFKLRDAKFSDGTPVTANDVIASLKRAQGDQSNWKRFFAPITKMEAVDGKTVKLGLDKPFTPLLNNLAMFSASILPAKQLEEKGAAFFDAPIGSGPFTLKNWARGNKIELAANPNYWQAGKPSVKQADLMIIGEDNSRVLQLQAGQIDAMLNVPVNQMQSIGSSGDITAKVAPVFRIDFVQLNNREKPFDDPRVRQALNYAVDKEGIIQGILFGTATPATSSMPVMRYHNEELKPYAYDPAKAKELLKEAGLADGFSTNMLVTSGDATAQQVAAAIQANLQEVGVKAELQLIESGTQWDTTKSGKYQMSLSYATSDTIDPDQLIGFTAVNPERANAYHTEWKNERLNELYAQERVTPDGPEREKMFKEMEQLVHDGAPYIFLYNKGATYAFRNNVEGFEVLPTSNWRLEDVVVK
ncbi:ABC transporter substrate-binding protein [Rhodoligotrophos ferricapiens]|uniref:ABC transporter substrate-binding protein n=1 Tax=Rhodoligotrophos ferricapiens TaxID=3069264 RepID=UPI00315CA8F9